MCEYPRGLRVACLLFLVHLQPQTSESWLRKLVGSDSTSAPLFAAFAHLVVRRRHLRATVPILSVFRYMTLLEQK